MRIQQHRASARRARNDCRGRAEVECEKKGLSEQHRTFFDNGRNHCFSAGWRFSVAVHDSKTGIDRMLSHHRNEINSFPTSTDRAVYFWCNVALPGAMDKPCSKSSQTLFNLAAAVRIQLAQPLYEQALRQAQEQRNEVARGGGRAYRTRLRFERNRPLPRDHRAPGRELWRALYLRNNLMSLNVGRTYSAMGFNAWGSGDLTTAAEFFNRAATEFTIAGDLREKAGSLLQSCFHFHGLESSETARRRGSRSRSASG